MTFESISPVKPVDLTGRLLRQVATGDQAAFGALYADTSPVIYGVVVTESRDIAGAEALTRDIYLEVWRSAGLFDPDSTSALSWILGIAHRRLVGPSESSSVTRAPE